MKDKQTEAYVCTGVFATPEQIASIKMEMSLPFAKILGKWPEPERVMHEAALKQGLPEIPGHYGVDFRDGEFIRLPDEKMPGPASSEWGK